MALTDARAPFEESFAPSGRDWVSTLEPYNEHLVQDYGELNLAFEVLLVFAAVLLERRLGQVNIVLEGIFIVPSGLDRKF